MPLLLPPVQRATITPRIAITMRIFRRQITNVVADYDVTRVTIDTMMLMLSMLLRPGARRRAGICYNATRFRHVA